MSNNERDRLQKLVEKLEQQSVNLPVEFSQLKETIAELRKLVDGITAMKAFVSSRGTPVFPRHGKHGLGK